MKNKTKITIASQEISILDKTLWMMSRKNKVQNKFQ